MDEVKQIVDEIHNIDPKISKSKILLYLYMQCDTRLKSCNKCPLKNVNFCDIALERVLGERELYDYEKVSLLVANYNRGKQ